MGDVVYPDIFKKKEKKIIEFPRKEVDARLRQNHLFRIRAEEYMKKTGKTWRDLTERERTYIRSTIEDDKT